MIDESGLLMDGSANAVRSDPTTRCPVLSVVVIGRNEGARLVRCFESIEQMRPPQGSIEVIYVDSGSTDGSLERAEQFKVKVIGLDSPNPCAAAGRNAGWRIAKAPIVLFLDGDTILEPGFVAKCIEEFSDPRVAVVFGNRREISPRSSIYNRVLDLEWTAPSGEVEFCGGDALIRREVLERVDGFDERLIAGEEPEMCRRMRALGFTILHVDRPMTGHDLAITRFSQYWRRAVRTGYAYAEVSARFRNSDLPLWGREARHNLAHGIGLLGIGVCVPLLSLATRSIVPAIAAAVVLAALAIRTAMRFRWKTNDRIALFLYALHSQLVHIPLLFGQLKYRRDRFFGRTAELIEYKDAASPVVAKINSSL
jgi:cellulose synthase/poly-beta-1,6-N-acetylglucosamine synthase-like glycosyltransferase